MRLTLRWFTLEFVKVALVLSLFVWIQGRVVDTKYEVLADTGKLRQHQLLQYSRLEALEVEREQSGSAIEETVREVEVVRDRIRAGEARLASEREDIVRLLDDRTGELRSLIESGIDRIEGTSHTAYRQACATEEKFATLESRIARHPSSMKELMMYPIVQLRGNGTVGSGVVIDSRRVGDDGAALTYILTAYHVVVEVLDAPGGSQVNNLRFMDPRTDLLREETHSATMIAHNEAADLALLTLVLPDPWPHVARLSDVEETAALQIFDRVYAVGCPLGNKPLPTTGEISSQDKLVGGQNFWMISAPTFFGNSGGGVFLADSGELIGISSMIYTYGKQQPMVVPHMGLFVSLDVIRDWLTETGYPHLAGTPRGQTRATGSSETGL